MTATTDSPAAHPVARLNVQHETLLGRQYEVDLRAEPDRSDPLATSHLLPFLDIAADPPHEA